MRFKNKSGIILGVALGALVWLLSLPTRPAQAQSAPAQSGSEKETPKARLSTLHGHLSVPDDGQERSSARRGTLLL